MLTFDTLLKQTCTGLHVTLIMLHYSREQGKELSNACIPRVAHSFPDLSTVAQSYPDMPRAPDFWKKELLRLMSPF